MIWHFFEVWFLFLIVFVVGGALGAFFYSALAAGPLAGAQGALANFVGDGFDAIKWRLGVGPDWRAASPTPATWPPSPTAGQDLARREIVPDPAGEPDDANMGEEGFVAGAERNEAEVAWLDGLATEEASGMSEVSEDNAMMRPAWLDEPRSGVPDNLQRIRGIGSRNEEKLHSLGIFHFGQIAAWTPAEVRWVGTNIVFPERIERDNWIGQAMILGSGGDPSKAYPPRGKKKSGS